MNYKESRRTVSRLAAALLTVSLLALNMLVAVHLVALSNGFYRQKWVEYNVSDSTGMSLEDLSRADAALTGYFTGKTGTPQVSVLIDGQRRDLYNATELTHLQDVRSLFNLGSTLEQALAAEVLGIGLYLYKAGQKKLLAKVLWMSAGVSLAALVALAVPAMLDFGGFWTNFHLVAFANNLWILDPKTDWLIRMFPEEFFFSAVERVGIYSSGISVLYALSGFLIRNIAADNRH